MFQCGLPSDYVLFLGLSSIASVVDFHRSLFGFCLFLGFYCTISFSTLLLLLKLMCNIFLLSMVS